MSWDSNKKGFNKIRTDRVFTTVHGSGKPKSYFIHVFIIFWLGYGTLKWYQKRKNNTKQG